MRGHSLLCVALVYVTVRWNMLCVALVYVTGSAGILYGCLVAGLPVRAVVSRTCTDASSNATPPLVRDRARRALQSRESAKTRRTRDGSRNLARGGGALLNYPPPSSSKISLRAYLLP